MDGKRPKRRKADDNPYSLTEESGKYFVSFKTSNGTTEEVEIGKDVYDFLDESELLDVSQMNEYDRHIEHSQLREQMLEKRMTKLPDSLEDVVWQRICEEKLHMAISRLPEIQRRRLILYYFYGMSCTEIAKLENCSIHRVSETIRIAKNRIKKELLKDGVITQNGE